MKIAFIGLGIMGKPMAKNLIRAGHELWAYDLVSEPLEELASLGAHPCRSSAEAASQCRLIITILPNSPHVKRAVMGPEGVLEGAAPGSILVDMSSIAPAASQEVEKACGEKGVEMLDAPVSGGEPKAIDGTLSIMVGGRREIFQQVQPLLLAMGSCVTYCGPIGAGNTVKLANQIIVACNIAACAEAFTLAEKSGVDPEVVFQAIRGGLAGSTVMEAKVPMMLENNFRPGFKVDLHIKDLMNALETGHTFGAPVPLTAQVMEMLQVLHAQGRGQEDHSSLVNYYRKLL